MAFLTGQRLHRLLYELAMLCCTVRITWCRYYYEGISKVFSQAIEPATRNCVINYRSDTLVPEDHCFSSAVDRCVSASLRAVQ